MKPLVLENQGTLLEIGGFISCSENLKKPQVAERIRKSIIDHLSVHEPFSQLSTEDFKIQSHYERTLNPGVGLSVWANYENTIIGTGTILGKRGVPSEKVGTIVANQLIQETSNNVTVDSYAADQLIPLMVLSPGYSQIRINNPTKHLKTNITLLDKFHPRTHSLEKRHEGWVLEYEELN